MAELLGRQILSSAARSGSSILGRGTPLLTVPINTICVIIPLNSLSVQLLQYLVNITSDIYLVNITSDIPYIYVQLTCKR